jgi:threonine synthase
MIELSTMRAAADCANSGNRQAASHAIAPANIVPQSTLRPWKMRAALQIMPQATNKSAFAIPGGNGGEISPSMLQTATENPPSR